MHRLIFLFLFFSAGSMLLSGAETGIVDLTPRAEDHNSVRACGGDLETVKAAKHYLRLHVFHSGEVLADMEFCLNGKIAISKKMYRIVVPAGEEVRAWINDEGTSGVIEGCINGFKFETPVPPKETPKQSQPPSETVPPPELPHFHLPPWNPVVPSPQPPSVADCPYCAAIKSDYLLSELKSDSKPIHVWAVIEGGNVVDGIWKFNGVEVGRGISFLLDPRELYAAAHGKAGMYFLQFVGKDGQGHAIACGLKGTPIELKKHGRRWWWKLPILHCAYTYTHDIKKWKGGPLVEKLVCPVEVAAVVWALSPGAAVLVEFKTGVGVGTLAP